MYSLFMPPCSTSTGTSSISYIFFVLVHIMPPMRASSNLPIWIISGMQTYGSPFFMSM